MAVEAQPLDAAMDVGQLGVDRCERAVAIERRAGKERTELPLTVQRKQVDPGRSRGHKATDAALGVADLRRDLAQRATGGAQA